MTPDMKRLCEAAFRGEVGGPAGTYEDCTNSDRRRYEAIVRAVLVALKEPSDQMRRVADAVEIDHGGYRAPIGYEAGEAFTVMIEAILAKPAKA